MITLLRAQEGQFGRPHLVVQRFHCSLDGREKRVADLTIELCIALFCWELYYDLQVGGKGIKETKLPR